MVRDFDHFSLIVLQNSQQIDELQLYLAKMAPFGRPSETHIDNLSVIMKSGFAPFAPEPGERVRDSKLFFCIFVLYQIRVEK